MAIAGDAFQRQLNPVDRRRYYLVVHPHAQPIHASVSLDYRRYGDAAFNLAVPAIDVARFVASYRAESCHAVNSHCRSRRAARASRLPRLSTMNPFLR